MDDMNPVPYRPIPLDLPRLSSEEQARRVLEFASWMARRRTVRQFAPDPLPIELIDEAITVAARAPSGANMQPWRFVVVGDLETKRKIREAAEKEERESYGRGVPSGA